MARWSTRKKDAAPKGIFRHESGVWAVRFTCGAGHIHQERVGPLKSQTTRTYHERRARALSEPGWCPRVERQQARLAAQAEQLRMRRRMTFKQYADDYKKWAEGHQRSLRTMRGEVTRLVTVFGGQSLDAITASDVERFLSLLLEGLTPATVNRYRDRLSGMFKRAIRLGLMPNNPVKGIPKHKEAGGRLVFLPPATADTPAHEELAIHQAVVVSRVVWK